MNTKPAPSFEFDHQEPFCKKVPGPPKTSGYWLTLETYVHTAIKKDSLLLYHSLTGKTLEYQGKKELILLVKKLKSRKNLMVVPLKEKDLESGVISRFVKDLRENFMGDLIDASYSTKRPVQIMPILTISRHVKYLKKDPDRSVGENIKSYLHEIFLYINRLCLLQCPICSQAYKQFPFCTCTPANEKSPKFPGFGTGLSPIPHIKHEESPVPALSDNFIQLNDKRFSGGPGGDFSRKEPPGGRRQLPIPQVKKLLQELSASSLHNINILGGDIFRYSKFEELVQTLNSTPFKKTYYSHYLNIMAGIDRLKFVDDASSMLKILVTFPVKMDHFERVVDTVKRLNLPYRFIFVVQGVEEVDAASGIISNLNITESDYIPFYNGENLLFFQENVFCDKDEILEAKPTMKEIYQNMSVNGLNFGKITILSDGAIYANVNAARLGYVGRDSMVQALAVEMSRGKGKSWFRVRKGVYPCKECVYELLCPPLSNYTFVVGRDNLCTMPVR